MAGYCSTPDSLVDRFVPTALLGGGKKFSGKMQRGKRRVHSLQTARLQTKSLMTTTLQIRKPSSVADGEERRKVHIDGSTMPIG